MAQMTRAGDARPSRLRLAVGFVVVAAVLGIAMSFLADRSATKVEVHHGKAYALVDPQVYVYMATHPRVVVLSPYVDRPLEPQLIAAMHVDPVLGFEIATTLLLAATAVAVYLLLLEWQPPRRALAGTALMAAAYPITSMATDPYSNDPVGFFCVSVGLLLVLRRRWWALAAVVLFGTMAREASAYVLLPAIGLVLWDRRRPPPAFWAALAAPLVAVATVSYSRIFYSGVVGYGTNHRPGDVLRYNEANHGSVFGAVVWAVCVSLGVAGVLAVMGFRRAPVPARLCALVLVPCVASMVIGSDWYRYLAFGLPPIVLLATFADVTTVGLLVAAAFELLVGAAVAHDLAHQPEVVLLLTLLGSFVVLGLSRSVREPSLVSPD